MNIRKLDPIGGIVASCMPDNRIRLEIWPEDREPSGDPEVFSLSIAQALTLMGRVPVAVQAALKGIVA